MKIFTSTMASAADIEISKSLGMGCLVASSSFMPSPRISELPFCAMDNGAFTSDLKGYPFMAARFEATLEWCWKNKINLEWVVLPDIVKGGLRSLEFSMLWKSRLGGSRWALVVQDGMTPADLTSDVLDGVVCVFVGGSLEWKWQNAKAWATFAQSVGLQCHIGRTGTLDALRRAHHAGADSCDSSSFVRNKSWGIVKEFMGNPYQETDLFDFEYITGDPADKGGAK